MKKYVGYKTELYLNDRQRTACTRHAGVARWTYNWGLEQKIEAYKNTGRSPSWIELNRHLNSLKKTHFPWLYEVSKCVAQEALCDLDWAYRNFYRRVKNGEKQKGFPRFKSRKKKIGSFRLTGTIRVFEGHIQLPRLGRIRLKESGYLPMDAHILSATVSERAGRWFVSVMVREEGPEPEPATGESIGIDLGLRHLATLSDGTTFANPRVLEAKLKQLARWQRRLARRKEGGRNREKARRRIARLHTRIANIRKDVLHKATSQIVKANPSRIVLEHLNVEGMRRNKHLARAISDVGFYEFRRQIEYKALWNAIELIVADPFYPSSKRCSRCGQVKDKLLLDERVFHCVHCSLEIDRDLNAAINLKRLAK